MKERKSQLVEPMKTGFAIRKVVTELVPFNMVAGEGQSPGNLLDSHLIGCAERGEEVQMVEFVIDRADWDEMRRVHYERTV